jgi:hypothetical protein
MNAADVKYLRRKVDNILGPLFLRPLRAREITDELKDHVIEASQNGAADPVETLGNTRMLRRTIGHSFLAETILFLISFILLYSLWHVLSAGFIRMFTSLIWIIPSDSYHPPDIRINAYTLIDQALFVIPPLVMAIAFRRWYFLTRDNRWVRWSVFIGIAVIFNIFLVSLFTYGLSTLNQELKLHPEKIGSGMLWLQAWQNILIGLSPWKYIGIQGVLNPLIFLFIPAGMLAYSWRKLNLTWHAVILLLTIFFIERSSSLHFVNGPKWQYYTWFYICDAIRNFGWGFWIMFYLNIFDHLWNWFGRLHHDRPEMDIAGD